MTALGVTWFDIFASWELHALTSSVKPTIGIIDPALINFERRDSFFGFFVWISPRVCSVSGIT